MIRVRMKDLALVAFAGGLLAFELVSLSEALPNVKKALADRGLPAKVHDVSASAAGIPASAPETAGSTVAHAVGGAVTGYAHKLAASTSPAKRYVVVTRATKGQRADGRLHVVTVKRDGSCAVGAVAQSLDKLREVEKVVDLALKHATL